MTSQHFNIRLLGGEFATPMSCKEAGCSNYANGWLTVLDPANADHAAMANWIRQKSGRRFYVFHGADALEAVLRLEGDALLTVTDELRAMLERVAPGLVVFLFPPGQSCFKVHEDREVVFTQTKRDRRRAFDRPREFNESFNEEAYQVARARERG